MRINSGTRSKADRAAGSFGQLVNALRAHRAEFGYVAAQGMANPGRLAEVLEAPEDKVPDDFREAVRLYLDRITHLTEDVHVRERKIAGAGLESPVVARLKQIPGSVLSVRWRPFTFLPYVDPLGSRATNWEGM